MKPASLIDSSLGGESHDREQRASLDMLLCASEIPGRGKGRIIADRKGTKSPVRKWKIWYKDIQTMMDPNFYLSL